MSEVSNPGGPFAHETWRLFRVQAGEKLLWLCVVSPEVRAYVYIPDSGRFHLNNGIYVDFIWDNELTYLPIGVDEARDLIEARVGKLPSEMPTDIRRRYLTDEQLDVEETLNNVATANR